MSYLYFLMVYAGPFIALAIIYLLWAFTAHVWQDKYPTYYKWVCRINSWLPGIVAFICIFGFILYLFGVF